MKRVGLVAVCLFAGCLGLAVGCGKKSVETPTRKPPVVQDMNIQKPAPDGEKN